jgi:hypothetical protein
MCVLVLLYQVVHGHWLVAGANRDEQLERPSTPPALATGTDRGPERERDGRRRTHVAFVAPRDVAAGGTWIGLNRQGLFVALTNRSDTRGDTRGEAASLPRPVSPRAVPQATPQPMPGAGSVRSRGLLVRDLLGCPDVAAARAQLLATVEVGPLDAASHYLGEDSGATGGAPTTRSAYLPFHLVAATAREALLAVHRADGAPLTLAPLAPGVHVIGNRDGAATTEARTRFIRRALGDDTASAADWGERLRSVLSAHPFGEPRAAATGTGTPTGHDAGASVAPVGLGVAPLVRMEAGSARPRARALQGAWPRDRPAHRGDAVRATPPVLGASDNPCLHLHGYGTRSSALIALSGDAPGDGRFRWWHAEGPPCSAGYEDYTGLLDELSRPQTKTEGM